MIQVAARLEAIALPGIPIVQPGDPLAALIAEALTRAELKLRDGDVIVVASKLVSRAESRFVDLEEIQPSARAVEVAATTGHDARHVEVILRESVTISRAAPGVLIVRHRLGFVVANAGVDFSNAQPLDARPRPSPDAPGEPPPDAPGAGPWVLLLPSDPDGAARRLRAALTPRRIGVIVSDSFGRPFRLGSVGTAIGAAGLPALCDHRGAHDLFGRPLDHTQTALADQLAAVADLIAGQADEARGAVWIRGVMWPHADDDRGAAALLRRAGEDLYA